MRANQELTQEEFLEQKTELLQEKGGIQDKLGQNLILKDKKLEFSFKKPYDVLLLPQYHQSMLALLNTFRTYEWTIPYQPLDYSFNYMQQILYPTQYS